jgi:hypothetical protein
MSDVRERVCNCTPPDDGIDAIPTHHHHHHLTTMADSSPDAFVNREEPVPVLALGDSHNLPDPDGSDHSPSSGHIRNRFKKHTSHLKENLRRVQGKPESPRGMSTQDRILEKSTPLIL